MSEQRPINSFVSIVDSHGYPLPLSPSSDMKRVALTLPTGVVHVLPPVAETPIKVWQIVLTATTSDAIVTFQQGPDEDLSGAFELGRGQPLVLPYTGLPWVSCEDGKPLIIRNDGLDPVTGFLAYTQAKPD